MLVEAAPPAAAALPAELVPLEAAAAPPAPAAPAAPPAAAVLAAPPVDAVAAPAEPAVEAAELPPATEAVPAAPPLAPSSTVVVVVVAEPLGNEVLRRSRAEAPNRVKGFVMALSNQAPEEAPPEAIKFSAVPATLAMGLETVSSIPDLIPSEKTLLAFDKLVAMF